MIFHEKLSIAYINFQTHKNCWNIFFWEEVLSYNVQCKYLGYNAFEIGIIICYKTSHTLYLRNNILCFIQINLKKIIYLIK
jgi:hypothetical protein